MNVTFEHSTDLNDQILLYSSTNLTDHRDEDLALVEISVQVTILCLALLGNSFILFTLFRRCQVRPLSRVYFFMAHLSFADLLVAIFNILPQLIWDITFRFRGSDFLCRSIKYLQVFVLYLSTYMLVAMAIDRYLAVRITSDRCSSRNIVKIMVTVVWVLSGILAIPQAIIFSLCEAKPGILDCWVIFIEPWGPKAYVTWFVLTIFGIPILIISMCYGIISYKIWKYSSGSRRNLYSIAADLQSDRLRRGTAATTMSTPRVRTTSSVLLVRTVERNKRKSSISRAKVKTLKLTLTVVFCFFLCWSPFCITQLWLVFNPPEKDTDVGPVQTIFLLLASLNSCTNPWIYLAFSGSLLNQLRICCGLGLRGADDNDSVGDEEPEPKRFSGTLRGSHQANFNDFSCYGVRGHEIVCRH